LQTLIVFENEVELKYLDIQTTMAGKCMDDEVRLMKKIVNTQKFILSLINEDKYEA
jgi:hypothetical protein